MLGKRQTKVLLQWHQDAFPVRTIRDRRLKGGHPCLRTSSCDDSIHNRQKLRHRDAFPVQTTRDRRLKGGHPCLGTSSCDDSIHKRQKLRNRDAFPVRTTRDRRLKGGHPGFVPYKCWVNVKLRFYSNGIGMHSLYGP
jgi:hypothetical protein